MCHDIAVGCDDTGCWYVTMFSVDVWQYFLPVGHDTAALSTYFMFAYDRIECTGYVLHVCKKSDN